MKTALIVVDVQKFFLHDAPDELPAKIAHEIEHGTYDTVAFTVFKNTKDSNFVRSLQWSKCASDEDTALPDEFVTYATSDNVFERDTYGGFSGTSLHEYLQARRIDQVVICGVDTDACVLATAFTAFDLGYRIDINFDLTFSGGELEQEAKAIMKRSLIAHKE